MGFRIFLIGVALFAGLHFAFDALLRQQRARFPDTTAKPPHPVPIAIVSLVIAVAIERLGFVEAAALAVCWVVTSMLTMSVWMAVQKDESVDPFQASFAIGAAITFALFLMRSS